MDHNMFCFQCEQTAGCTGCTSRGVCGKDAQTAQVQDRLTGALIGLARAADTSPDAGPETWQLMIEGLFATLTNVNFDPDSLNALTERVWVEKQRLVPDCAVCTAPCGRTGDYDLAQLWGAQEDIRSLKSLLLFGSRGMAAYAYHAMVLGYRDESVERFLSKALFAVGEDWSMEELLPLVLELGEVNLRCMALLDKANTESFGKPSPVHVPFTVEPGPFIVVSGHDLHDLKLLLEQTADRGIAVYTHGEMLPAHAYPELKNIPISRGISARLGRTSRRNLRTSPRRSCSRRTASCRRARPTPTACSPRLSSPTPISRTSARKRTSRPSSSGRWSWAAMRRHSTAPA